MSLHYIKHQPATTDAHDIYLGTTHVVEVKKGGLYIGVYLITRTQRRRGVILPYDIWLDLVNSIDVINLGIDFARDTSLGTAPYTPKQYYGGLQGAGFNYGVTPTVTQQFTKTVPTNGQFWPITENAESAAQFFFNTQANTQTQPTDCSVEGHLSTAPYTGLWGSGKTGVYTGTPNYTNTCGKQKETSPIFTSWYQPGTQSFQDTCGQT
jgi:hypothetical protein